MAFSFTSIQSNVQLYTSYYILFFTLSVSSSINFLFDNNFTLNDKILVLSILSALGTAMAIVTKGMNRILNFYLKREGVLFNQNNYLLESVFLMKFYNNLLIKILNCVEFLLLIIIILFTSFKFHNLIPRGILFDLIKIPVFIPLVILLLFIMIIILIKEIDNDLTHFKKVLKHLTIIEFISRHLSINGRPNDKFLETIQKYESIIIQNQWDIESNSFNYLVGLLRDGILINNIALINISKRFSEIIITNNFEEIIEQFNEVIKSMNYCYSLGLFTFFHSEFLSKDKNSFIPIMKLNYRIELILYRLTNLQLRNQDRVLIIRKIFHSFFEYYKTLIIFDPDDEELTFINQSLPVIYGLMRETIDQMPITNEI